MKYFALGIESSCDDTAASIVSSDREILSNIVLSQVKEHLPYKGVVPEIASRAHMNYLDFAIKQALLDANLSLDEISCIAATGGPGLIGGIIVGTMYGKAISSVTKKPYIAINHLEGHALTSRLVENIQYPYLLLLASGGHCQFIAVLSLGEYMLLGQTLDDAVGEAFDKVGKMLGFDYPGGPAIEKFAKNGDHKRFKFPKSMCDRKGCDMSFSGLKTAVRTLIIKEIENLSKQTINDICASFQFTIAEILKYKLSEAIKLYEKIAQAKTIVISGGVAANQYIINELRNSLGGSDYKLFSPPMNLCTDNAAMIAWAGMERFLAGKFSNLDFCPKARWSLYSNPVISVKAGTHVIDL